MVKIAVIGAGKMGISHISILGAHPKVQIVGICDVSKMVLDVLTKYGSFNCFTDYKKMIENTKPDAVVVAVPTKLHGQVIHYLLERKIHVFAEKPFCLTAEEGEPLVHLAKKHHLVNQVGYHNKFVGPFQELKKLLDKNVIGKIIHFQGESYGPVVLKKDVGSWRNDPLEGGGCLMDYSSHVIDLINYFFSPIVKVIGSSLKSIYSTKVEDAVYSLVELSNKLTGIISVNWSDETYRKMSTTLTIVGINGKIICDANELKIYFNRDPGIEGYSYGWNIKNVTDLTKQVDFYLRGEEYSAQMDYFIEAIENKKPNRINTFESAWITDQAMSLIRKSVD